jgi:hypothetical protein
MDYKTHCSVMSCGSDYVKHARVESLCARIISSNFIYHLYCGTFSGTAVAIIVRMKEIARSVRVR